MGNFSTLEETRDRLAHVVYAVTWAPKNIVKKFSRRCQEQVGGVREGNPILIGFFCLYGIFFTYLPSK